MTTQLEQQLDFEMSAHTNPRTFIKFVVALSKLTEAQLDRIAAAMESAITVQAWLLMPGDWLGQGQIASVAPSKTGKTTLVTFANGTTHRYRADSEVSAIRLQQSINA